MFEVVAHFYKRHTSYSFDPFIVIIRVYLGLYSLSLLWPWLLGPSRLWALAGDMAEALAIVALNPLAMLGTSGCSTNVHRCTAARWSAGRSRVIVGTDQVSPALAVWNTSKPPAQTYSEWGRLSGDDSSCKNPPQGSSCLFIHPAANSARTGMIQCLMHVYHNLAKPTIEGKKRSKAFEGTELDDESPSASSVKSQIVRPAKQ